MTAAPSAPVFADQVEKPDPPVFADEVETPSAVPVFADEAQSPPSTGQGLAAPPAPPAPPSQEGVYQDPDAQPPGMPAGDPTPQETAIPDVAPPSPESVRNGLLTAAILILATAMVIYTTHRVVYDQARAAMEALFEESYDEEGYDDLPPELRELLMQDDETLEEYDEYDEYASDEEEP